MSSTGERPLPLSPDDRPEPDGGLSRRAALQGLAGSLGAVLAAGAASADTGPPVEAHPVEAHVAQRAARTTPKPPLPKFLDAHQLSTLTLLAELIVPGAAASRSPQFIDEVLAIERPEVQQRFIGALGAFDAAARDAHRQAFGTLARERQVALLVAADGQSAGLGRDLQHLKTWIAGAHYSSEPGMKELGFTGGMFYAAFPACTHKDGHQ